MTLLVLKCSTSFIITGYCSLYMSMTRSVLGVGVVEERNCDSCSLGYKQAKGTPGWF